MTRGRNHSGQSWYDAKAKRTQTCSKNHPCELAFRRTKLQTASSNLNGPQNAWTLNISLLGGVKEILINQTVDSTSVAETFNDCLQ